MEWLVTPSLLQGKLRLERFRKAPSSPIATIHSNLKAAVDRGNRTATATGPLSYIDEGHVG
jgi:hypothetical protein